LQSTLESDYLEIGYNARQSITLLVVSGALSMALENPKERMIFVPGRTDNRSRLFPNQGSAVLTSTVWGDGIVDNPPGQAIQPGDTVHFIPFSDLLH